MINMQSISKSLALAGAVVTISDLAQPIAPFSAYLIGVTSIVILILLITKFIVGYWHENLSTSLCFASLLFTLSSVLFIYQGNNTENHNNGILSSNVELISRFQADIGIIKDSTLRSEHHLSSIDNKLDNVKQEVSEDPRKELANLGVAWSQDNFLQSIERGDLLTIELFLKGGMNPNSDHWMCLPIRLSLNKENPVEVYNLLKRYNLDINNQFKTGTISGPKKTTLFAEAIMHKNIQLMKALLHDNVERNVEYEIYAGAGYSTKKVGYQEFLKNLKLTPEIKKILG